MAESRYRIVSEIDPQTAAGANKVRQDLRGVQQEARATEAALSRSFNQQKFEQQIGGISRQLDRAGKSSAQLAAEARLAARGVDTVGMSWERASTALNRARQATAQQDAATTSLTGSNRQLEASLRRVLMAVDQEAAEQVRLNALLGDAKRLFDAGAISAEQYARVQSLVAQSTQEASRISGAQRLGLQQLGFQLGDVATMWSLGARPAQIFGSQIGQIVQAVQLMTGGTSRLATFLMGPWGISLTIATIALAPFLGKLLESNDALGEAIDKLREDARETELNRRAKEAFNRTLEGQIALQREMNEELTKAVKSQQQLQQEALRGAQANLSSLRTGEASTQRALEQAQEKLRELDEAFKAGPPIGAAEGWLEGIIRATERAEAEVKRLQGELANTQNAIRMGEQSIRAATVPIVEEQVEALVDPVKAVEQRFQRLRDLLVATFVAGNVGAEDFRQQMEKLRREQEAATEQAEKQKKALAGVGVAVFRSRQQAIGIAGRELQQAGLRVGENEQFGGVRGSHPGMGAAHGKYAIDVNVGAGIVEADVPDLRARFDALARRYQARGYRVLWNGWVYEAGDNGPTRRIPSDQHQHRDHMHVEAPSTIVGQPTQASSEAQARREEQEAMKREERARDFVQAIVDKASVAGLPSNRKTQLAADIDEAFLEFQRRFDRAPDFFERWKISTALTEAEARAQAQHFREAYVEPLEDLRTLDGLYGRERAIRLKQMEEERRLGRELTDGERQQIEESIRGTAELERKRAILESVQGPLAEYADTVRALNELLAEGSINQTTYNARLAELQRAAAATMSGVTGRDPNTGRTYDDLAAIADENARFAAQLESFQQHREELLRLGIDYDHLEEAARQEHVNRLAEIDRQRYTMARDVFGQLAQLQSSKVKEIAAVGKAAAITQATIDAYLAINKALSSLPPPFNIAMAAAIGATAFANVASIAGLKDGGEVVGPGGPRDDKVLRWLSNGEFVVNAEATARNRPLLEAINSGRAGGPAGAGGVSAAAPSVSVAPAAPPVVNLRNINILDASLLGDFLATPEGDQVMVNWVNRHPELIGQVAGGGAV